MIKPKIKEINDIEIEQYQNHPRILELRIILMFKTISKAYDYNTAIDLFQALSKVFRCNWQLVNGIINNVYNIRALEKRNKIRFRQEVVFMGLLYNETRYVAVKNYLDLSLPAVYAKYLQYENFVTRDWLDELDQHIAICGIPHYRLEAERFIEGMGTFLEALGRVSIPKV